MAIEVRIPTILRSYTDGAKSVEGSGSTLDELFADLEHWLADITGYDAVSLQPNAGSQGEYAGLLAIHDYHASRGEPHRDVCLIPSSAHGTNAASAALAGSLSNRAAVGEFTKIDSR